MSIISMWYIQYVQNEYYICVVYMYIEYYIYVYMCGIYVHYEYYIYVWYICTL